MTSSFEKFRDVNETLLERDGLLGQFAQAAPASDTSFHFSSSPFEQFPEIVGRSEKMMGVMETILKVSKSPSAKSNILILGESGTGKELVASAIHRLSDRAGKPFLALNCSAIPEQLLESELFGHEKGAFTGADKKRQGVFSRANGGTIFLDEIGDMPYSLQAKLLRVLQEKKFSAIGSSKSEDADVRIISATNINIEDAISQSTFRLDLFYRLNVLPISLPPLRERGEDVVRLLEYFIVKANIDHQKTNHCYFSTQALNVLKKYTWPGNVRELQNLVERLVIMKDGGKIDVADIPQEYLNGNTQTSLDEVYAPEASRLSVKEKFEADLSNEPQIPFQNTEILEACDQDFDVVLSEITLPGEGIILSKSIEFLENHLIRQALNVTGNNKNQAAKLLGMNRTTLVERIKKRGLVDLK